jgi:hypothetical protein
MIHQDQMSETQLQWAISIKQISCSSNDYQQDTFVIGIAVLLQYE